MSYKFVGGKKEVWAGSCPRTSVLSRLLLGESSSKWSIFPQRKKNQVGTIARKFIGHWFEWGMA